MDAAWILLVLVAAGATSQPANDSKSAASKPVEHVVHFAGQANWSNTPSTAPPAVTYDRYGQPIAQATQDLSNRTQAAISQTGTAVKDGFEAGVRATTQQLSTTNPFASSTAAPSSTGTTTGVSSPWTGNSAAAAPAPVWTSNPATTPSLAGTSSTAASAAAAPAWTSIGSSVAAPPLIVPQSPMNMSGYGSISATASRNGPNFPLTASNDQPPLHSVLREPGSPTTATSTTNRADDLAAGWTDNSAPQQPSLGRFGSQPSITSTGRELELGPPPASSSITTDPRSSVSSSGTGTRVGFAGTDGWPSQSPPPAVTAPPSIESANINRQLAAPPINNGMAGTGVSSPFVSQATIQPQNPLQLASTNAVSSGQSMTPMGGSQQNPGMNSQRGNNQPSEQAWMPLILAVLTLAGSLAANLFLGMSYLDARQKYQSLVRKTADTFRRVKAAAA